MIAKAYCGDAAWANPLRYSCFICAWIQLARFNTADRSFGNTADRSFGSFSGVMNLLLLREVFSFSGEPAVVLVISLFWIGQVISPNQIVFKIPGGILIQMFSVNAFQEAVPSVEIDVVCESNVFRISPPVVPAFFKGCPV